MDLGITCISHGDHYSAATNIIIKYHLYIKANNNAQPETAQIQSPLKNEENTSYMLHVILERREGERLIL